MCIFVFLYTHVTYVVWLQSIFVNYHPVLLVRLGCSIPTNDDDEFYHAVKIYSIVYVNEVYAIHNMYGRHWVVVNVKSSQIAKFMGPTWGPPGSCRPQMGPC